MDRCVCADGFLPRLDAFGVDGLGACFLPENVLFWCNLLFAIAHFVVCLRLTDVWIYWFQRFAAWHESLLHANDPGFPYFELLFEDFFKLPRLGVHLLITINNICFLSLCTAKAFAMDSSFVGVDAVPSLLYAVGWVTIHLAANFKILSMLHVCSYYLLMSRTRSYYMEIKNMYHIWSDNRETGAKQ